MTYSRSEPSPRYRAMMGPYTQLHREGERQRGATAEETYRGVTLLLHVVRIKALIKRTGARTVLDYGAGKGLAYDLSPANVPGLGRIESVLDYWGVDTVHCYDPCYPPFSRLPHETFDGVVSTDVMEHCPEEDLGWIIGETFAFARKFVFASIASYPASTHLPNGENAHCTIRSPVWWRDLYASIAMRYPGRCWQIVVQAPHGPDPGAKLVEHDFDGGNAAA